MTIETATPAPLTLWLTDRSRYRLGTGRCAMARYLASHWGPTGYGITLKADSLPLATGLYVHFGVEAFGQILVKEDRLPDLAETRRIIQEVRDAYLTRVTDRGFRGVLGGPHTEETITEQSVLISGLLWALRLKLLLWLHQSYRLLSVERERLHLLSCTCGAGPLDALEHIARGCQGKALMLRTDLLGQRRGATTLAYFEVKTTGWESEAWTEQWESDPQLGLGTIDADRLHGAEVTELYIVGLNKGARRKDKADPDGRKRQTSSLCYGYCRPGGPPVAPDDWLPAYEWLDDAGQTKRAPRTHRRRAVWELKDSDWPVWSAHRANDPSLLPEEFWVRTLPSSVLDKVCFVLGPMNRQDHQIASLRRSMLAEEEHWQRILWELYEIQQHHGWASETVQQALDRLIPRSWNCRPFGKEYQCEFFGICHRQQGWEDPIGSGKWVPRLPHHEAELTQAIARGLLAEQAAESEWEGE